MPLNTASAAVHITPTVIKTFLKHYKQKAAKLTKAQENEITDDILFDEAFHIVKSFIELGTQNTVDSLQAFTNTHIVSPPWAAVSPVVIPLQTCNKAADILLEWFDPDELQRVVGGERWWQVRGLDGVEAEWVTERNFLKDDDIVRKTQQRRNGHEEKLSPAALDILKMDSLEKVMLYVHGGAYFWGSINTHRYQILKYARKLQGRMFAVNYRKAPQYPWPCPLQDVIAAYLYLIEPPPSALHSPIPPGKIVVAGDSAGAGLCVSLLTVLRDLGKPLPAGGVLISPWVDLTHSFPSIMSNAATDIIPPHGFIHKPSLVWPISPSPGDDGRIKETESNPPPKPGRADTLQPNKHRVRESHQEEEPKPDADLKQKEMLSSDEPSLNQNGLQNGSKMPSSDSSMSSQQESRPSKQESSTSQESDASSWMPKPPKVLMEDDNATPLELRSQIQLYATNEQLTHPLVSPVLQGSLGNLCPLYIIAGDGELLRDEIIYMAHRAAYPDELPPPEIMNESKRQRENMEKFRKPTKVHLQVFDGMCHVLTVFTFHRSAKYAYKAIAEFAKHVIDNPEVVNEQEPAFPELKIEASTPSEDVEVPSNSRSSGHTEQLMQAASAFGSGVKDLSSSIGSRAGLSNESKSSQQLFEDNKATVKENIQEQSDLNRVQSPEQNLSGGSKESSLVHIFPDVVMIRERVDIRGRVRQMEPKEEIPCLRLKGKDIGMLKEAPARRWMTGQQEWDEKFKGTAKKVAKRRKKNEETYQKIIERARELGLIHADDSKSIHSTTSSAADGEIQEHRRWGPLDLEDEKPPNSAIAGRRDTLESLALLRKTLYYTAPRTISRMPKRQAIDVIKAAFSPHDDPTRPPPQSVSEQQNKADTPMHGLSIWASIMTYFTKHSSKKATAGKNKAKHGLKKMRINFSRTSSSSRSRTLSEQKHSGP